MPTELTREQLKSLTRLGAAARLEELRHEQSAILAAFPDLASRSAKGGLKPAKPTAAARADSSGPKKARRRRRKMTAAEKKAVSERMKKYWANKNKGRG